MEVRVEYTTRFGGTAYARPSWGVNVYGYSPDYGEYPWVGCPCGSLRDARAEARRQYQSLASDPDFEGIALSLKANKR